MEKDNFFSFGVDAFAFDSDEILEVTFDLLYDEDGDSDTTDLSLLSAFDFLMIKRMMGSRFLIQIQLLKQKFPLIQ